MALVAGLPGTPRGCSRGSQLPLLPGVSQNPLCLSLLKNKDSWSFPSRIQFDQNAYGK